MQTDASDNGAGVVYTRDVPHHELRRECMRPRVEPRDRDDQWKAQTAWSAGFEAPRDAAAWRVAVRRRLRGPGRKRHINDKELGVTVDAVRWALRSPQTRRCRLVLQSDSTAAIGALRKGRSSSRPLLRHCRRLAALTLAEQLTLEGRWVPTAAPCGDDLDGIYEGLHLPRRERSGLCGSAATASGRGFREIASRQR